MIKDDALLSLALQFPSEIATNQFLEKIKEFDEEQTVAVFKELIIELDGVKRHSLVRVTLKKINSHKSIAKLIQCGIDNRYLGELGNWLNLVSKKIPFDKLLNLIVLRTEEEKKILDYHASVFFTK
jgi:thioredoxin reductase